MGLQTSSTIICEKGYRWIAAIACADSWGKQTRFTGHQRSSRSGKHKCTRVGF